jgi:hypothetical protein
VPARSLEPNRDQTRRHGAVDLANSPTSELLISAGVMTADEARAGPPAR